MSIHPTALVSSAAAIGANVTVGPFTIVHDNVEIGEGTVIGSHCEIGVPIPRAGGRPLRIGPDALIRSHSVFYEGSVIGRELVTGHRVTVREGSRVGRNVQLGTLADVQGDCSIGDYTRTQTGVIIGKATTIGNCVWLFTNAIFLNDPTPPSDTIMGPIVDEFAVICADAVIHPGVRIGEGAVIAAQSNVTRSVEAHRIVCGNPLQDKGPTSRIRLKGSRAPAYPWTAHFSRGYPEDLVAKWLQEALDRVA